MKVRDVLKKLHEDGWFLVKTKGSHRQFRHQAKPGKVTVAGHPSDEAKPGTLQKIWKQASLEKWHAVSDCSGEGGEEL